MELGGGEKKSRRQNNFSEWKFKFINSKVGVRFKSWKSKLKVAIKLNN
jgi:hypothetical protein